METVEKGLYLHKNGTYYIRPTINGKRTWLSTGTRKRSDAKRFRDKRKHDEWANSRGLAVNGVNLASPNLSISWMLDEYAAAGYPSKGMKKKAPSSILGEMERMHPLRAYWGSKKLNQATISECYKYHTWRNSGGYKGLNGKRTTKGGDSVVDHDLTVLKNALRFAVDKGYINSNPLDGLCRFRSEKEISRSRDRAPTQENFLKIAEWLASPDGGDDQSTCDWCLFSGLTGLRLGETLMVQWSDVNFVGEFITVHRQKNGVTPFYPITEDLAKLLAHMEKIKDPNAKYLFHSPWNPRIARDGGHLRRKLAKACRTLQIPHSSPHGLRAYFVIQARESGIHDAVIASLIGDSTGAPIIAKSYGDVRQPHLIDQAKKIKSQLAVLENTPLLPGILGKSI